MTWQAVYQRSLSDLLKAEKARREAVEADRARLVGLLTRLAQHHDGQRLEEYRRQDPGTPEHWSAEEWAVFFTRPPTLQSQARSWGANGSGHGKTEIDDLKRMQDEVRRAETHIEHLQTKTDGRPETEDGERGSDEARETGDGKRIPAAKSPPVPRPRSSVPLTDFSPPKIPYKYKGLLKNHGLNSLRWRRGSMMLYLMATCGINAHLEMDVFVAKREGLSYRSNSTKKPLENLAAAGLVITETLRMEVGDFRTALKLARLTDEGKQLCDALGWQVVESDWDRLIRLHQGQKQTRHTLAVLYFALLARVRGWTTEVVPEVDGSADPDILVTKGDERYFVEVELGTRGSEKQTVKWKNLADLQSSVAICAPNVKVRERLANDCRLANLSGVATDLATLVAKRYYESKDEPLWVKEW
ncbi:MAG: hypothetical protein ISS57_07570 [Anaerolineales bacterium]|nr:hypothetical protein [Anaerolineales bacterium]